MSRQSRNIESTTRHQIQHRFDVASFGPANIIVGIIESALFVRAIVTSRAVGHGNLQFQFLLVINVSRYVQPDRADDHNPALSPCDFASQLYWLIARSCSRNKVYIRAATVAEPLNRTMWIVDAEHYTFIQSDSFAQLYFVRTEIQTDHPATVRF